MTYSLTSLLQHWSVHAELHSHLLLRLKYSEALKNRKKGLRGFFSLCRKESVKLEEGE